MYLKIIVKLKMHSNLNTALDERLWPHLGIKGIPKLIFIIIYCQDKTWWQSIYLGMRNMIEETPKLHAIDWGIVSLIGGREEKFWQPCQRVFRGDFAPFFITDERTLGARNRVVYLFSYSILVLYSRALQFYQGQGRHTEFELILKEHSYFYTPAFSRFF